MAQFEGGTQGMLLERTENFDEYGHSIGDRDTEYAYKKPSVLWTDVRGIKDFLPTSARRSVRSAEFFNRSVRFITVLAIILAIAFRSWWPVIVGGGLFLLILLLSAGLETVANRARAQGAIVGAAVATAVTEENANSSEKPSTTTINNGSSSSSGRTGNGSTNSRSQTTADFQGLAGDSQSQMTQPTSTSNVQSLTFGNGNGNTGNTNTQQNNRSDVRSGTAASLTQSLGTNGNGADSLSTVGENQTPLSADPFNGNLLRTFASGVADDSANNYDFVTEQNDLSVPSYGVNESCLGAGSCNAMPCCGVDCNKPLLDSMTSEQLRAANIRLRPTEPYPEPLSPFAQAMMERYREISAQEKQRRAPCLSRLAQLEQDAPYDPTATIPNPSRHNNWLQVDPRYRAEDPLPYKHVRAQAVGYADDASSDELRGSLMNKIMRETNGKGPKSTANTLTTLIGIDPESASLSQVSGLYRRSSLHDNVDSIYAGANSCRPKQSNAPCNVVHDPTERMINDMYEDSTDKIWKQQFLDRRPPPWINPNDSQSRRAEEQSAIDRQSWRGFSMHQGP